MPVMMEFGFSFPPEMARRFAARAAASGTPMPNWQELLLKKGWGYAVADSHQHPGRQWCGADQGGHRPGEQGAAPPAGRLGSAAGLGLGREPGAGLLRERSGGRREAGRDRRAVAVRQGGAGRDGLRPAVRDRVHRLLRRRGSEAASPQFRRAGREPHRCGRISLDGGKFFEIRRAADGGRLAGRRARADRPVCTAAGVHQLRGGRRARRRRQVGRPAGEFHGGGRGRARVSAAG